MQRLRFLLLRAGLAAALAASAVPAAAGGLPQPRQGTTILWAAPGAPRPAGSWTVTGAADGVAEILEREGDAERPLRIAEGIFPVEQGGRSTRFDRSRLTALRPFETARVATFDAEEAGPEGHARWFVHVTITGRLTIDVPAGRFEVVVVEHHRRGTGPDGAASETVTEWSIAPAIGLPVAMRAWRLADGRAELVTDLQAAAVHLP